MHFIKFGFSSESSTHTCSSQLFLIASDDPLKWVPQSKQIHKIDAICGEAFFLSFFSFSLLAPEMSEHVERSQQTEVFLQMDCSFSFDRLDLPLMRHPDKAACTRIYVSQMSLHVSLFYNVISYPNDNVFT